MSLELLAFITALPVVFSLGVIVGIRYAARKTLKMLDELHTMLKEPR